MPGETDRPFSDDGCCKSSSTSTCDKSTKTDSSPPPPSSPLPPSSSNPPNNTSTTSTATTNTNCAKSTKKSTATVATMTVGTLTDPAMASVETQVSESLQHETPPGSPTQNDASSGDGLCPRLSYAQVALHAKERVVEPPSTPTPAAANTNTAIEKDKKKETKGAQTNTKSPRSDVHDSRDGTRYTPRGGGGSHNPKFSARSGTNNTRPTYRDRETFRYDRDSNYEYNRERYDEQRPPDRSRFERFDNFRVRSPKELK